MSDMTIKRDDYYELDKENQRGVAINEYKAKISLVSVKEWEGKFLMDWGIKKVGKGKYVDIPWGTPGADRVTLCDVLADILSRLSGKVVMFKDQEPETKKDDEDIPF